MKFYELPDNLDGTIEHFDGQIKDYQDGKINPIAFKGMRVAQGVYEQRKPETHMIRIRCAAGGFTPAQLRHVGMLAKKYGSGEIHVTTRQEVQIHYVDLSDVIAVTESLKTVGLSPRGGGGNTVRNIMSSHDSGIAKDEAFDVDPYAMELTSRMVKEEDSWELPRKFKIAFANNDKDNIRATMTCLGFIAKIQDGKQGFKVYCAGGMGAVPMLSRVLFDFVTEDKVYYITKAMKVMFDKYGNRRQRHKAKLKFLWDKLGEEAFRVNFHAEYDELIKDASLALTFPALENKAEIKEGYASEQPNGDGFEQWKKRYVTEQKQAGLYHVEIPLKLGDIDGDDAANMADVLDNFGDNCIRLSVYQNVYVRNIPEEYLGNIFNMVMGIESLSKDPAMFADMVACTGADTCKLGICLPRGLTPNIQQILKESDLDLDGLKDVRIHISGCPNTCGCHHAADLGFFGAVMKQGKEMLPGYNILVGAILEEGKARFAQKVDTIASKYVPAFIKDFLGIYLEKKDQYENFTAYIDDCGKDDIKAICENYRQIPEIADNKEFYFDWGSDEQFSLLKGQKAECSAGMFDMIGVDSKAINEAMMNYDAADTDDVKKEALAAGLFAACRMLLVTRGIEVRSDDQVYDYFLQHFIKTNLVPEKFIPLVEIGKAKDVDDLLIKADEVKELTDHMQKLYKSMDDSLRFKGVDPVCPTESGDTPAAESGSRFKDLRGVACPMNFVKTKLELDQMTVGDKLTILLDDGEPIENVPGSVKNEGHIVVKLEQLGDHWMVEIEKK